MHKGIVVAAKAGHQHSVNQSLAYVTHMVGLNTDYGWPAAEFYWFELQKEVERGWHVLDSGSPWNPTCMFPEVSASQGEASHSYFGNCSRSYSTSYRS